MKALHKGRLMDCCANVGTVDEIDDSNPIEGGRVIGHCVTLQFNTIRIGILAEDIPELIRDLADAAVRAKKWNTEERCNVELKSGRTVR